MKNEFKIQFKYFRGIRFLIHNTISRYFYNIRDVKFAFLIFFKPNQVCDPIKIQIIFNKEIKHVYPVSITYPIMQSN